jgi:hypothetical protein
MPEDRPNWQAHFTHRYTITPAGEGATIAYVSAVWPENYRPFWLHPARNPAQGGRRRLGAYSAYARDSLPTSGQGPGAAVTPGARGRAG